jgi:4-diphosphocytidyl-2-C-methyl-D-erythritol kinase
MLKLERRSPAKINLLLNILGKRPDGFHELETLLHPLDLWDRLEFERQAHDQRIHLTCSHPGVPTDSTNLIYRAARLFFGTTLMEEGIRIHVEKNIPVSAGLAGGSSNAAHTLLGLNELFGFPLEEGKLMELAAQLGSDVPFFLQNQPALATGRGEKIQPLSWFRALRQFVVVLVHPGFGVATAWAYENLAGFPQALHGSCGRAAELVHRLQSGSLEEAAGQFYNSLEAPVLKKYPLLRLYQEFFRVEGAPVTLMSGSGSTTFALVPGTKAAERLIENFQSHFGTSAWICSVPLRE